ncbi:peptidylprolyl isomerase [Candidatus Woesearchaeota archaeon]|nr:peptidylprolyl isomerase [Candidatus Woesearchaeota archaeon]
MANDLFKDVDELTEIEYDSDLYPKRKSQAELDLETELKKDSKEIEKTEQKTAKKTDSEPEKTEQKTKTEMKTSKKTAPKKKKFLKDNTETKEEKKPETKEETKKKENKKSKKSEPEEQSKKKRTEPQTIILEDEEKGNWAIVAASSLVIIAIIIALYFAFNAAQTNTPADKVLALVNNEPIYQSQIDFRIQSLSSLGATTVNEEIILNQIIDEKLILQDAEKQGIKITKNEAEKQLQERMLETGIEIEELKTRLAEQNMEYEQMVTFYQQSMIVNEYINQTIIPTINTSEKILKTYYEENKNLFKVPEQAQVRHILILFTDENETETYTKTKDIQLQINENATNFCDLVKEYTEDIASKETCGEYNYTMNDPLVPEFKEAGFTMDEKEIRLVKSQFGYHIMQKIKQIPETTRTFEEVKEQIKLGIQQQEVNKKYDMKVEELKKDAIIEIYTDDKETENTSQQIPEPNIQPTDTEETNETESQKTTPSLTDCISQKATMYTVYWSPDNEKQLSFFEDEADKIKIIECDKESENYDTICETKDIRAYPAWEINGKIYNGIQNIDRLKEYTEC